jgi:hypothetical protein
MTDPTTQPAIDLELSDGANWISRLVREFRVAVDKGDMAAATACLHNIQVAARHVEAYLTGRLNGKADG